MFVLDVFVFVVFGSSVGSVCSCWVCSFVASILIDLVVFAYGRTTHSVRVLLLLLLFDLLRSNAGKFLLLFCLL